MKKLRGIGLHEQPGFKINSGREIVIGMRRPSEAIDAAVLATSIGVYRSIEADVGRAVAGEDRLGMLDRDGGPALLNSIDRLDAIEPFALDHPLLQIEARRCWIARCAAPFDRLDRHPGKLRRRQEQNKNK